MSPRTVLPLIVLLLAAGRLGATDIEFNGVLSTGSHQVVVDSATLITGSGQATYITAGWGGDSAVVDSFAFPRLESWPVTGFFFCRVNGSNLPVNIAPVARDTWYEFPLVPPTRPKLLFWGASGLLENPARPEAAPLLRVSPSVVTSSALISANLPPSAGDELVVCDASGRPVRTLRLERRADGLAAATWRGDDESGAPVPGGIYFCRAAGGPAAKLLVAR